MNKGSERFDVPLCPNESEIIHDPLELRQTFVRMIDNKQTMSVRKPNEAGIETANTSKIKLKNLV